MGKKSLVRKESVLSFDNVQLIAYFTCPSCSQEVSRKLIKYDFHYSSSECDLCGSHDYLGIEMVCPNCNAPMKITIVDC